jgi:hypothetical protein
MLLGGAVPSSGRYRSKAMTPFRHPHEEWISGLGPAKGISMKLWASENFDVKLSGFDELRSTALRSWPARSTSARSP